MMTSERQITVHHLDTSRHDRQFHPYRRPAGYVRFSSVPQISAERQYLMAFMVVSRRDVTGTSPNPLPALGLWSQEEATCRILSRSSYCYIVRRDRRYHPYKRPGKYFNKQCRRGCLPFYLNYRYFSACVQRYLHDTAANIAAEKETEIESLSKDNTNADAQMTYNVQIAMLKPPEMTTPELDIVTSEDVSHPVETDTSVGDSLTDWGINLLTDSDLQQMREWESEPYVKGLSSPAQSKATTDVNTACFDDKQGNNLTSRDNVATSNVPRPEAQGSKKVSEQVDISAQDTETTGPSEIDVRQPGHEETENEDDLLQIDPSHDDLCDSALGLSESSINQLLDIEKTKNADLEPKQSIMEENQDDSDESPSMSKTTVTKGMKEGITETGVNADLEIESKRIEDTHKDQPETKSSPGKTQEVSSDETATSTDFIEHSRKSEKEVAVLKTDGETSSNTVEGYDDNQSCDMKTSLSTGNLQSNFVDRLANSDVMTNTSVSSKTWVKLGNKPEQLSSRSEETAKKDGFIFDKLQNLKNDMKSLESDTISKITHNRPKVPRIMYINPAMIAQLTTPDNKCEKYPNVVLSKDNPSTKHTLTPSKKTSCKQVVYLDPSEQSKLISSKKENGLLLNGRCEIPTVTTTKLLDDSNKNYVEKKTKELCNGNTNERHVMDELHQTKDTAEPKNMRIISLKPSKTRKSAAMFFQKEINKQSESSSIKLCTDGSKASSSARRIICLNPNKNKNLETSNSQVTDPIKAKDREQHSNNSLSMWLRHGSVSSDPNKSRQKLSDEERLQLRKRRFGTTSSDQQQTSTDIAPVASNKRRIIRLNRH